MPPAARRSTISGGAPHIRSTRAPRITEASSERLLSTTTRMSPYGHVSRVRTFSNVFRPITNTSTVAMNSAYPWGSPPPSGRKSKSPLCRAINPSTLIPTNTDAFIKGPCDAYAILGADFRKGNFVMGPLGRKVVRKLDQHRPRANFTGSRHVGMSGMGSRAFTRQAVPRDTAADPDRG